MKIEYFLLPFGMAISLVIGASIGASSESVDGISAGYLGILIPGVLWYLILSEKPLLVRKWPLVFSGIPKALNFLVIVALTLAFLSLLIKEGDLKDLANIINSIGLSVVAAYVFYLVDVNYPKNKKKAETLENILPVIKQIIAPTERIAYMIFKSPPAIHKFNWAGVSALEGISTNDKTKYAKAIKGVLVTEYQTVGDQLIKQRAASLFAIAELVDWFRGELDPDIYSCVYSLSKCEFFEDIRLYLSPRQDGGKFNPMELVCFSDNMEDYFDMCKKLDLYLLEQGLYG